MLETRRRSVTKSLIWRLVGVVWTWIGAYLIILWTPERFQKAAWISTFIVVYHHSTRMVMYYAYERLWSRIRWGRPDPGADAPPPLTLKAKAYWAAATLVVVAILFLLILYVTPLARGK
ncbi:MAG TPA: hypothetical protein VNA25_05725 [Phycisphaerae bacterium]|nr:hypothetical protein [Phycisphaerae bacterium]HUT57356.1 hypothetical protein [Phycisphaerae bacterium]